MGIIIKQRYNISVLLIDGVSLAVLLGLVASTHVFRRRGRLSDRLFFAMVIMNLILAVSDIVIDLFAGFGMRYAKITGKLFYSIATLGVYLLAAFAILFFSVSFRKEKLSLRNGIRYALFP